MSVRAMVAGAFVLAFHCKPASAQWLAPPDYTFSPVAQCPLPVKLYKHCDDQMQIFLDAAAQARREKRLLLVVFGADWCPECHSLEKLLPSDAVLAHPDFAGRIDMVHIAVSVLVEKRLLDVWSGLHVLRAIAAKAGPRAPIKGIPYAAVIDPESDARTAVFTLKGLVRDGEGESGFDPGKVRGALKFAVEKVRGKPE